MSATVTVFLITPPTGTHEEDFQNYFKKYKNNEIARDTAQCKVPAWQVQAFVQFPVPKNPNKAMR